MSEELKKLEQSIRNIKKVLTKSTAKPATGETPPPVKRAG